MERRPLATRSTRWAQALAGMLARGGVSPNAISVTGLAFGLLAGATLAATAYVDDWPRRIAWLVAALLVQLRLLANLLDGMVAVASERVSRVGELYNELPDRFSDAAILIGLGYAAGGQPELGYLAALAAVLTAYVRALGKTAGAPQIYVGPMAKQQRMFLVTLCALAAGVLPEDWVEPYRLATWTLAVCLAGTVITIVHRLVRIVSHLRSAPMNEITHERLFSAYGAFDHPATVILLAMIAGALAVGAVAVFLASRKMESARRKDLWRRYLAWLFIVPVMAVPILAGAFWTILLIALLSLFCYREYARATGLFREKLVSFLVVLSIVAVHLAVLDNWYLMFVALFPFCIGAIASFTLFEDRPHGYIQRVALGSFAFALFGSCLGHLGYLANDANYRPMLIFTLVAVELNDVAAFATGRLFGRRKLCPNTSPNKTIAGAIGAVVVSMAFVSLMGSCVFAGTPLDHWDRLLFLGFVVSVVGQFGDLILSSIKRDLGLKDMDVLIPGHGGLLDRFDSLILVAPVMFHYINYFVGIGADQPICVFSGAR